MRKLIVVAGAGTEVGKTWVSARLIAHLRERGFMVAARKPVQSFDPSSGPTDAAILAAASGEQPNTVCSRFSYPLPLAPPIAAAELGLHPPTLSAIIAALSIPASGFTVIESVGGLRSPLADNADTVTLIRAVSADMVVLVVDAGLGAIGSARSGCDLLDRPTVVFLNRFHADDRTHRLNRRWLREIDGFEVSIDTNELAAMVMNRTALEVP
jgi:dethiobiotin synthetase